ncbi:MAG: tetratricopeptide repeat protein [Planctomycetota bacterium]|jgi:Tfp pilus assembly protein PilF
MVLFLIGGCADGRRAHPYVTSSPNVHPRNTYEAQRLNEEGLRAIEQDDHEQAERLFREALEADLFHASAHNNLGLVLVQQGFAYDAAWEFQYAAKLSPSAVQPRNNLGLVMEKVGQLDDAIAHYEQALELEPNSIETMSHLARAHIKSHHKTPELRSLLRKIALQTREGDWSRWARRQLLTLSFDE